MASPTSKLRAVAAALCASAVRVMAAFAAVTVAMELAFLGGVRLWAWPEAWGLSSALAVAWALAFAAGVLGWPWWGVPWRWPVRAWVALTGGACALDAVAAGTFGPGAMASPWLLAWAVWPPARGKVAVRVLVARRMLDGVVALLGVLLACALVGRIDERQPADAIVVFGAGVMRDGSPSPTLRERTLRGCALYEAGLAPVLVLSGGRGEGAYVSEPVSMSVLAVAQGVPVDAMVLDEAGVNTLATVRNLAKLARQRGWSRVLMVSHDYHLLRIRMFARREGVRALTVPARGLPARKRTVWLRELAALWWYFFQPGLHTARLERG